MDKAGHQRHLIGDRVTEGSFSLFQRARPWEQRQGAAIPCAQSSPAGRWGSLEGLSGRRGSRWEAQWRAFWPSSASSANSTWHCLARPSLNLGSQLWAQPLTWTCKAVSEQMDSQTGKCVRGTLSHEAEDWKDLGWHSGEGSWHCQGSRRGATWTHSLGQDHFSCRVENTPGWTGPREHREVSQEVIPWSRQEVMEVWVRMRGVVQFWI